MLTDIYMLLMVENRIKGWICHSINRYRKANNKYIKNYDENKESSYLKYWHVNHCVWAMSQNVSDFDKSFIKSYNGKK